MNSSKLKNIVFSMHLEKDDNLLITQGNSMYPTLKQGHKVKIAPVQSKDIKKNDILISHVNSQIICHRFLYRLNIGQKQFYFLKGDNSKNLHIVLATDILGKVAEVFDNNNQKINEIVWSETKDNHLNIPYCALFMYAVLWQIKNFFCGGKKFRITSYLARSYWRFTNKRLKQA